MVHEVVDDELLICGVEAEPSWKIRQSSRARHGDKKWRLLSSDVLAVGLLCSNLYTTVYYYTQFILLLTTSYCIDRSLKKGGGDERCY